ncbi:MAG: RsmD family RNA methyltransferase [Candidatus Dormibacteraceae bacterium]
MSRARPGQIRIRGGQAGGRVLTAPDAIRPTQALVREAMLNMLAPWVRGARVLDLFAGSGALGLQALSEGADFVTFVDHAADSVAAISANLGRLGWAERAQVVGLDCQAWLTLHPAQVAEAGIMLLDPPYNDPVLEAVLNALDGLCSPGTRVAVEHARGHLLPPLKRLVTIRDRRYGVARVTLLEMR